MKWNTANMYLLAPLMQMIVKLLKDGNYEFNKISYFTLFFPFNSECWNEIERKAWDKEASEERMKYLESMGLPLLDSGIKIVPRSMLGLPQEMIEKGDNAKKQMETQGYTDEDSPRPIQLINFKSYAKEQFKLYAHNENTKSPHLRQDANQLKLAFKYNPSRKNLFEETIGFVPQGAYNKRGGEPEGWTGMVHFFQNRSIGTCAYTLKDVKSSHTAAQLAMEDVLYNINNKATLIHVKGSKSSGFIYKVEWYDDITFHELECANMKYSSQIKNAVIELAKQIDIG